MVTVRRMLLGLAIAPWTGVAIVHLWDPTAFRFDPRAFLGVTLMLAAYAYLAEAVFALPILFIRKKSRNPPLLVAALWASLGATGIVILVLLVGSRGSLLSPSEFWSTFAPRLM